MPSGDIPKSDIDHFASHFPQPPSTSEEKTAPHSSSSSSSPATPAPGPNHGAVLLSTKHLQVQSLPPPPTTLPPTHLLLAIKAVGICGSDVHYLQHGQLGPFKLTSPMLIGHECAGLVLACGSSVTSHTVGQRVAIEPGIPCRTCSACTRGRYNLCPSIRFFATPPVHGALARYIIHPADLCFPLPSHLSYAEGAFCEPMSVGVMACRRGGIQPGERVAVMGAGPIGLITSMVALAFGASRVVITDVSTTRLQVATKVLGGGGEGKDTGGKEAKGVVVEVGKRTPQEVSKDVRDAAGGPIDVSFDAVGMASTFNTALLSTRSGGRVVCIGLAEPKQDGVLAGEVAVREVDVRGVFRYCHTYPTCVELLASGKVDVKPLITHTMKASEGGEGEGWRMKEDVVLEGFEIARTGRDGAIKVMFEL